MRERIYEVISTNEEEQSRASKAYDLFMVIVIFVSLIPLCFKEITPAIEYMDAVVTVIFITDYLLRVITADIHLKKGLASFVMYPFTPMAILDLLSIVPGLIEVNAAFRTFRIVRLLKLLRIFRIIRYSKSLNLLVAVLKREKNLLLWVLACAVAYVIVSAMIVFNIEPDTFDTFFDAVYWACVSLTTVGYGDVFCQSTIGKTFTMLGTLVGTAVIALPAGIITGGFVEQLKEREEEKKND